MSLDIINPATEEIITTIETDTQESIQKKIALIRKGQASWKQVSVKDRLACISRFGELIQQNKQELAETLTKETGKPLQQSFNEITGAHNRIDHLEQYAEWWLADESLVEEGATLEYIRYEPLGVIGNISAWNFPYNVGYNVFLYALVAGNAVLYKPSEYASLTGLTFQKYLYQAGIPEDVFQVAIGTGEVGQFLLDAELDGYFFTGSLKTGQYIAQQVAPKMVPLQLELGGKDPLYVMDDVADVKQAAINAAEGAFYNNGQSCCAVERIYVDEKIHDEFVQHFVEEVTSFSMGNPDSMDTFVGPLTRDQQRSVLEEQVKDATEKGAKLLAGGRRIEGKGYYFEPTVLTNVNHEMNVMRDESFGPIIGIQKVHSDEEAINLMLDTEFGLTSAVFSSGEARAKKVLAQMNTGTVYWNCCDRVSPNVPWSGRKNSGLGSTLSSQGIRAFVQPKAYQVRPA
jgi:acyl-CoA reductase-like NAD-dependent aldehyde dehydrogenase